MNTGSDTVAKIAEREEYLVIIAVNSHTSNTPADIKGLTTNMVPKPVATPFPPLNFSQIGKICPKTVHMPANRLKLISILAITTLLYK